MSWLGWGRLDGESLSWLDWGALGGESLSWGALGGGSWGYLGGGSSMYSMDNMPKICGI